MGNTYHFYGILELISNILELIHPTMAQFH
nr:MAG TPA: hypothetical protein [Bacteriophage sp.]